MTEFWDRRQHALDFAVSQHRNPTHNWYNRCQLFVRTACGAPGGEPSAHAAYLAIPHADHHPVGGKHPPAGVPIWFHTNNPNWHVALSAGRGYCWSTDILRHGKIDKVSIGYIEAHWNARYLGWTESINGRRMWPA